MAASPVSPFVRLPACLCRLCPFSDCLPAYLAACLFTYALLSVYLPHCLLVRSVCMSVLPSVCPLRTCCYVGVAAAYPGSCVDPQNKLSPRRSSQTIEAGSLLSARPHGLTFTWWGCYGLCLRHQPTELAHSF